MNQKYKSEESRIALAREIAGEAMVLLKNEDRVLPLPSGKCVALLGRTQLHTIIGGGGSGAKLSDIYLTSYFLHRKIPAGRPVLSFLILWL